MHIESLKTILSRDISDLKDIAEIIEPGYSLSKIEVQILKSRIKSLSTEIEELLNILQYDNQRSDNKKEKQKTELLKDENYRHAEGQIKEHKLLNVTPEEIIKNGTDNVGRDIGSDTKTDMLFVENADNEHDIKKTEQTEEALKNTDTTKRETIKPVATKSENKRKTEPLIENGSSRKTLADQYIDSTFSLNEMVGHSGVSGDRASVLSRKPIGDIHKAIKLNDKVGFIRELFNGDSQKYTQTIDKLNGFDDFEQAVEFLNKNFSWDQNSENFKMFIEIIYRRYMQ